MNKAILLVLLSIVLIAVAIPFIIRSLLWNRVLKQLHKGNYDTVLKMLNTSMFKLFYSEYDREYNALRVYLAQGNNRKIEEQTNLLLDKELTPSQAYQVASQTYFYFLDRENKDVCERLLVFMKQKANDDELQYNQMLFRIMIEKKSEDIKRIEEMLEQKEGERIKKDQIQDQHIQIGILQYLLSLQYAYIHDMKQMEFYGNKARSNLKGTPYHKRIKKLLTKGV